MVKTELDKKKRKKEKTKIFYSKMNARNDNNSIGLSFDKQSCVYIKYDLVFA